MRFNHITLVVADLERSKAFYSALGLSQIVDTPPRYARFVFPESGATLSVEVTGASDGDAPPRATLFFECDALDETAAELKARGDPLRAEPARYVLSLARGVAARRCPSKSRAPATAMRRRARRCSSSAMRSTRRRRN